MKDPQWWATDSITIRTDRFTEAERAQVHGYLAAAPCGPGSYPAGYFDRLMVKPTRWQRFKGWLSDLWAKVW